MPINRGKCYHLTISELKSYSDTIKNIHFVGIGGVSMSALAEIMHLKGYTVTGSDMNRSGMVEHLQRAGIRISVGHAAEHVSGADLVVYTAAISKDNPELLEAERLGIPTVERAVFLGFIMTHYKMPVGISGTHGKTTTTSLLSIVCMEAGLDPTVLVGGTLPAIGGNYRIGSSDLMIFEACEYVDSFLNFCPKMAVILNIEADHLDYFKDIHQIIDSFHRFASICGPDGCVVANFDDANVRRACEALPCKVISFGFGTDAHCRAVIRDVPGFPVFDCYWDGELLGEVSLSVPGRHNVLNSLSVIAAGLSLGIPFAQIAAGLAKFKGVGRRFEYKGEFGGVTVVDDYAHHPTEISATLASAKSLGFHEIYCIFQPHTYTRTKLLFDDFVRALSCGVHPVLVDIYAAREKSDGVTTAKGLADAIPGAVFAGSFEAAADYVKSRAKSGDAILTVGAGNVFQIADLLLQK